MKHEKIFNRPDGSKVKIIAELYLYACYPSTDAYWKFEVQTLGPRKRKWEDLINTYDLVYRRMGSAARMVYEARENLKVVTPEEVLETQKELWEKLKPTPINITAEAK